MALIKDRMNGTLWGPHYVATNSNQDTCCSPVDSKHTKAIPCQRSRAIMSHRTAESVAKRWSCRWPVPQAAIFDVWKHLAAWIRPLKGLFVKENILQTGQKINGSVFKINGFLSAKKPQSRSRRGPAQKSLKWLVSPRARKHQFCGMAKLWCYNVN